MVTRKNFAQITVSVSRVAASWTQDLLCGLPEALDRDASKDSIERFREEIQDLLRLLPTP